jgi:hypothetical protein
MTTTSPRKIRIVKKITVPKKDGEKNCNYNTLSLFLDKYDKKFAFDLISQEPTDAEFEKFKKELNKELAEPKETKKAVLGIDIYKYSKYDYNQQKLIPFVFASLRKRAAQLFFDHETFFSSHYDKGENELENDLINTGDGGYLFFKNPIDAIVFLSKFNALLHLFNSYHLYPNLRKYLDPLTVRYTITYDRLYKIDSKYYGPAIIKNARIISKDKLNRFLIDDKTYEWFLLNTNGIENLPNLRMEQMGHLIDSDSKNNEALKSVYFCSDKERSHFQNIFCQKLEKISVKDDDFEVYNLMIQCFVKISHAKKAVPFITSIGNMNCNGI